MNQETKVYLLVDGIIVDAGTDTDMVNEANAQGLEGYEISENADFSKGVYMGEGGGVAYLNKENEERMRRVFG